MISSIPIVENKSKSMVIFMFYNIYTAFCFASSIICITFAGVLKIKCYEKEYYFNDERGFRSMYGIVRS